MLNWFPQKADVIVKFPGKKLYSELFIDFSQKAYFVVSPIWEIFQN